MTSGPLFFTMLFQIIEICGYSLQSGGGLGFEALIWKFVLGSWFMVNSMTAAMTVPCGCRARPNHHACAIMLYSWYKIIKGEKSDN